MEDHLDVPVKQLLAMMQQRIMRQSGYFGIQTLKSPTDFWVYQELIFETKPDVIIELGNYFGGSTLALAHLCDNLDKGRVIGVDVSHAHVDAAVRRHPRITLIEGDAAESFGRVQALVGPADSVMVIEDSSHTFDNTLAVLNSYSALVKPGGYFIVEDSICHHGLDGGPSPGPYEAIEAFLGSNRDFQADRGRESFFITWNPKGYLKRVAGR